MLETLHTFYTLQEKEHNFDWQKVQLGHSYGLLL